MSLVAERRYPSPVVGSGMLVSQAFPVCVGDLLGLSKVTTEELIQSKCLVLSMCECRLKFVGKF